MTGPIDAVTLTETEVYSNEKLLRMEFMVGADWEITVVKQFPTIESLARAATWTKVAPPIDVLDWAMLH